LLFYTLKDEDGTSSVKCFQVLKTTHWTIEEGMEVKVIGHPSIFLKNAGFHLNVREIEPVGEGAFQKAFLRLRAQLETEGLFAQEHKKPIPRFPEVIGLITSPDADAKRDVLRILKNRWAGFTVKFFPTTVQGRAAVGQIVSAIAKLNQTPGIEVGILTRGGGSLEDLQAFNSEEIARAIYGSRIPIVCGIGHEADVTIADLVADIRASTPSNAAERVVPDRRAVLAELTMFQRTMAQAITDLVVTKQSDIDNQVARIEQYIDSHLVTVRETTDRLTEAWALFRQRVVGFRVRIEGHQRELASRTGFFLERWQTLIESHRRRLTDLNPLNILSRGYSVTLDASGQAIRSASDVATGDSIQTRLHKGTIQSTVEKR